MSWSQASDIHQCPKMWHHKHVLRDLPRTTSEALELGKLVHSAVEQFFLTAPTKPSHNRTKRIDQSARWAWDNRPTSAIEWTDDHRRKLWLAMYSVEDQWKLKRVDVGRNGLERKMRMEYFPGWQLVGAADMIATEGKKLVLTDFKTGKVRLRHEAPVEQVALYAWMWEQIDGNRPIDVLSIAYLGVPGQRYKWDEFEFIKTRAVARIDGAIVKARDIINGAAAVAQTSALCGWCPALGKCEDGQEVVLKRIAAGRSASAEAIELLKEESTT